MNSFKPFDFKFVFVLLILIAEDSVPKVSDMGDIGDQNYLPGGGEIDTRVHTILPRLPLFSGETKDAAFDLWKYEVECLRAEGKREADVRLAIRRSLKGQASRTLMTLGVGASVDDILLKFQSVFGPTETAQNILSRFYSLQQDQTEDAGAFAARLEDAILQAVQLGRVRREDVDAMLCEAFEGELRRETKSVTSYLFTPRNEFSKLLVEVKRKERELVDKVGTVASVQASEVDALKTLVLELRSELRTLKNERSQQSFAHSTSMPQQHQTTRSFSDQAPRPQRSRTEPVCWRCNMPGHVRSGCRMPLNGNAFVGRGIPQAQ